MAKDAIQHLQDLVALAQSQLGVAESPKGSNRGEALEKYFAADDYKPGKTDDGYPWCAAFICWLLQEWMKAGAKTRFRFTAPRTPSAFGLIDWAHSQRAVQVITAHDIQAKRYRVAPGDIVVWNFSHVSLCEVPQAGMYVTTIDGNTDKAGGREGYEVARKTRPVSKIRAVLRLIPSAKTL